MPGICLTTNACYFSMASFNAEGDQCAIAPECLCRRPLLLRVGRRGHLPDRGQLLIMRTGTVKPVPSQHAAGRSEPGRYYLSGPVRDAFASPRAGSRCP